MLRARQVGRRPKQRSRWRCVVRVERVCPQLHTLRFRPEAFLHGAFGLNVLLSAASSGDPARRARCCRTLCPCDQARPLRHATEFPPNAPRILGSLSLTDAKARVIAGGAGRASRPGVLSK